MKIFITGICGFVASTLARRIREAAPDTELFGVDNLMRLGSESNRRLTHYGIKVYHGDILAGQSTEQKAAKVTKGLGSNTYADVLQA